MSKVMMMFMIMVMVVMIMFVFVEVYDMSMIMFMRMAFMAGASEESACLMRCEIRYHVKSVFNSNVIPGM